MEVIKGWTNTEDYDAVSYCYFRKIKNKKKTMEVTVMLLECLFSQKTDQVCFAYICPSISCQFLQVICSP